LDFVALKVKEVRAWEWREEEFAAVMKVGEALNPMNAAKWDLVADPDPAASAATAWRIQGNQATVDSPLRPKPSTWASPMDPGNRQLHL